MNEEIITHFVAFIL